MKLYKFKSLRGDNFKYALDIITNKRLFCSKYSELNDPFEGLFFAVTEKRGNIKIAKESKIDSPKKICSLSRKLEDVRLWAYYADGFRGIAIEIDFSNLNPKPTEVKYIPKLSLLEKEDDISRILSEKTKHWEFENEYRIIQDDEYYCVNNNIKAVYLGNRMSDSDKEMLIKIIPPEIEVYTTKIDYSKVIIEQYKCLLRSC